MTNLRTIIAVSNALAYMNRPWLKTTLKVLKYAVAAAVVVYLFHKLQQLGWHTLWMSLPRTPWFYLIFACSYLLVPLADSLIYSLLLKHNLVGNISVFISKMIYNDVVDYSGEAQLALWTKRQFSLEPKAVLSLVKDVNILSGLAGNSITLAVAGLFVLSGQSATVLKTSPNLQHAMLLGILTIIVLMAVILVFRRQLLQLPFRRSLQIFTIHVVRAMTALGLQALQWMVALPLVPITTWLVFLAGGTVLGRIPFLPNRNLVFMAMALSMTALVNVPKAAISGVFLASGGLSLALSALCIIGITISNPTILKNREA